MALLLVAMPVQPGAAQECAYLYGIHDHDPRPDEYLGHMTGSVGCGWVTATVAIGHNPADYGGVDFSWFVANGHTVVCRLNNGYCTDGTIPLPEYYADFAQRCANFVQNSPGCDMWVIGNETNLAVEWPPRAGHKEYLSPASYADCFRQCYNAIKAVRPDHKVISQALAPWAGPYGSGTACGYTHDGVPLNWVQYLNQMLTAIEASGGIDGIALHINSRGYAYGDIHSTARINVNGQLLYWSFYVYKDWVDYGIPPSLYHLPLYATECNGMFYWKGGHPEDPSKHYEAGWMQAIHDEINSYNQTAAGAGKPIYRCINMYRWCAWCDGWNIDGGDNPYKGQMLADLDSALAAGYTWPDPGTDPMLDETPSGDNLSLTADQVETDSNYSPDYTGDKAIDGIISTESKWTSAGSSPPHWLTLDLGDDQTVDGYIVRHSGAAGDPSYYNAESFEIQAGPSMSGPWTTQTTVSNTAQEDVTTRRYITPKSLRYVRLYITDPGIDNYARVPEFEVRGTPAPPPPPPPGPGDQLIDNGDFSAGIDGWSVWIERDDAGDFSASVPTSYLRCTGSDYNGGVYQQFDTGAAGNTILISGNWASDPTIADAQWAEVIVINSSRLPTNGVDESPGTQPDDVLIYKNDTWTTPGGWLGTMADTSPVTNVGQFIAAQDKATIVIKSGNVGSGLTGLVADDIDVRIADATGDYDNDGNADLDDFLQFVSCLFGPAILPDPVSPGTPGRCLGAFDFDADDDVDLYDFSALQAVFEG